MPESGIRTMSAVTSFTINANSLEGALPGSGLAPSDAGGERLPSLHKQTQRNASGRWHPNDERSHGLRYRPKQLRGGAPGERAPSDAGGERLPSLHKQTQRNDSREWHPNDERSHDLLDLFEQF
eukprot:2562085-Amphidinium_carterae.1